MRKLSLLLRPLALVSLAVSFAALTGCDSDWYDDEDGAYVKSLFIYLNVADQDGEALEDATVWVDGSQQNDRTDDSYRRLGNQFPPDWRGWRYNWSNGWYRFDVRDCMHQVCTIEIMVSRTGYQTQRTYITFGRGDPDEIYMRQTFVMEQTEVASAAIVDCPNPPEVISLR